MAVPERVSARPEPGSAGDASWLVGVLVAGTGALAADVGVLAAAARVGVGVGALSEPFPHAVANDNQIIANTVSAQRS